MATCGFALVTEVCGERSHLSGVTETGVSHAPDTAGPTSGRQAQPSSSGYPGVGSSGRGCVTNPVGPAHRGASPGVGRARAWRSMRAFLCSGFMVRRMCRCRPRRCLTRCWCSRSS